MTTQNPVKQSLPPISPETANLEAFLVKFMGYSASEAKGLIRSDFAQISELAARAKEAILEDKSITPAFKEKLQQLHF